MPIEYDIIKDKQLVWVKGSGTITSNDVISHLVMLAADNRYKAPMKKLVDYRSIDDINILQEEAGEIASTKEAYSSTFHGERCAFVSPEDLTYGTSRVHQALIDSVDINTEVFRDMNDALNWLGVSLGSNLEK